MPLPHIPELRRPILKIRSNRLHLVRGAADKSLGATQNVGAAAGEFAGHRHGVIQRGVR